MLEDEYVKILEKNIKVRKELEHGTKTKLSGKEVDELLGAGANIALKNRDDKAALDIAHDRKQGEIAKRLRRAAKQG